MTPPDPTRDGADAYVALGSNLGDRRAHLGFAVDALDATPGVELVAASGIYETDPIGPGKQGPYLNAVVRLRTSLAARALLERMLEIEAASGRRREREAARWQARTLDLDLLLVGEEQIDEPGLEIPHPRLHQRAFVLEPLCELAPQLEIPGLEGSVAQWAERAREPGAVRGWEGPALALGPNSIAAPDPAGRSAADPHSGGDAVEPIRKRNN